MDRKTSRLIVVAVTILLLTGTSLWALSDSGRSSWTVKTARMRAALIDELSQDFPDPAFLNETMTLLAQAGYATKYYPPSGVTVQMFKVLPTQGYGLIILRAHTVPLSIISRDNEMSGRRGQKSDPIWADVGVMTSEPYSGSSHIYELLANELVPASIGETYFAITPAFVRNEMVGMFPNSTIIMMGCGGLFGGSNGLPQALIDRGASAYVAWNDTVSATHTDEATLSLLRSMVKGNTLQQAVISTTQYVGPDLAFGSYLKVYSPVAVVVPTVNPTPALLSIVALILVSPVCFFGVFMGLGAILSRAGGRR